VKNLLFLLADQFRSDTLGAVNPAVKNAEPRPACGAGRAVHTRLYSSAVLRPSAAGAVFRKASRFLRCLLELRLFPAPSISDTDSWPMKLKSMVYFNALIGK